MSLKKEFLARFINSTFVETGTFDGRGVLLAKEVGFKTFHTIELDPERAKRSKEALRDIPNVTVYEGDTVEILPKILSRLYSRATIFLDAHPVGEQDQCKIGKFRHPLLHELRLIDEHSIRRDHTILVDDRHEFPLYPTTDEEVTRLIRLIHPGYKVKIEGDVVVGINL